MKFGKLSKFVFLFPLLALVFLFLTPGKASAHCPVCVVGAAAGLTLTRWIGVDDSVSGIWIGAILGATSFWLYSWLLAKKTEKIEKFKNILKPAIYLIIFASTIWSFYQFNLVIRMSQIFGFDKLTFGIVTGGILFYVVDSIKIKHYFNYQRIVISLGSLTIWSLILYILINYYI